MSAAPKQDDIKGVVQEVSKIVNQITGVQLGERQYAMVESRLKKRMMELKITGAQEYLGYLQKHKETETQALVSLMTTHHTYFFREYAHFEYIEKQLPQLIEVARKRHDKKIHIWSAACSRGQESYSLAMFFHHLLALHAPDVSVQIFGSDVDPDSVNIAKNGVYRWNEVKEVPTVFMKDHWARGSGDIADFVKAKKSIKDVCTFDIENLMNLSPRIKERKFDVIFCRNVFIYFTPQQIKDISENIIKLLQPTGTLMVGISETLNGLNLPVHYLGPSIYTHATNKPATAIKPAPVATAPAASSTTKASATARPTTPPPTPASAPTLSVVEKPLIRVLCVDDSPTILKLLEKILTKEAGFQIVGTASNGVEAFKKATELHFDVMTLDIHMPEMTGIQYLENYMNVAHPPVVILSSVNREDQDLAIKCLNLGVADYVEKPALNNIEQRAEEIRLKLTFASQSKQLHHHSSSVEQAFQKSMLITRTDKTGRMIFASVGDYKKVVSLLPELKPPQAPTVLFLEGSESAIPGLIQDMNRNTPLNVEPLNLTLQTLAKDTIYIVDLNKGYDFVKKHFMSRHCSILVYSSSLTQNSFKKISDWKGEQLLLEDIGKRAHPLLTQLKEWAKDLTPATSFAYLSNLYLSEEK